MDSPIKAPRSVVGRGSSFARLGLLLALLALLGCQAQTPATTTTPDSTGTAQPTGQGPSATWPRTVVDDEGTSIEIGQPPERVISLSPANTEIVFALGGGDTLVGGTDFDDYPPEASGLPDVATFTGVLFEQVVELRPDLVLAAGNNFTPAGDIERLRELGFDVLVVYAETVADVLADIRLIGRSIGADEEAESLAGAMQQRMDEVTDATAQLGQRPRVFYQIGSEPEIYAPAPDSFLADMVVLAGGEPITTGDPVVFSISVEQLIEQDPEVIVLGDAAYGVCPEQVSARPGWSSMTAVRAGAIRPVDDTIVTRPGPRLAEGLAALALAIQPEAAIAPPADSPALCGEAAGTR
jgi:iron complex transport system substrate-binding protein